MGSCAFFDAPHTAVGARLQQLPGPPPVYTLVPYSTEQPVVPCDSAYTYCWRDALHHCRSIEGKRTKVPTSTRPPFPHKVVQYSYICKADSIPAPSPLRTATVHVYVNSESYLSSRSFLARSESSSSFLLRQQAGPAVWHRFSLTKFLSKFTHLPMASLRRQQHEQQHRFKRLP